MDIQPFVARYRGGIFTAAFLAAAVMQIPPLSAQDRGAGCVLESIGEGRVAGIIDGRSFTLDDGREVRLAAIDGPPLPRPGESGRTSGTAAKTALQAFLHARTVTLKRLGPVSDRYGRIVAFVLVNGSDVPVQYSLLAQGHAWVMARPDQGACRAELLAQERAARAAGLGLWADPVYAVRRADDPAAITSGQGRFAVIEGKVLSVRGSGGSIYLNFGRRWSRSFTVTILKRNEHAFAAAGIEPSKLEGRVIRVRGWIEQRNGPRIEAMRPEQIEIAEQN